MRFSSDRNFADFSPRMQNEKLSRTRLPRRVKLRADGQNLASFIVPARSARSVRSHAASALGTFIQLWRLPAVRGLARAKAHLGCFAFRNSHTSGSQKQEIMERQGVRRTGERLNREAYSFNFSLSSSLQAGGGSLMTASGLAALPSEVDAALQTRLPSRSQCG